MQRGSPGSSPPPPLLARGAVSQHTLIPPLGWKWNPCFPLSCYPKSGMSDPSCSAICLWECLGEMPGSQVCSSFQCLPWTQRAPRCHPDFPCPGHWLCCQVGVSEREEMFPFPSVLSSASALCPDTPLVPKRKAPTASSPSFPLHQPSLQAQLSRSPKKWGGGCLATDSPRRE